MDKLEFLKRVFIPFYWFRQSMNEASFFYTVLLVSYIIARFTMGIVDANNPNRCILRSIGEIVIAPVYTLGCNIGKDRFEIKVN